MYELRLNLTLYGKSCTKFDRQLCARAEFAYIVLC